MSMATPARVKSWIKRSCRSKVKVEDYPHLVLFVLESPGHNVSPRMDAKKWRGLPHDILEMVLLWLPSVAQVRFRAVCRSWCALLSSPDFLRRSAHAWSAAPAGPKPSAPNGMVCAIEHLQGRLAEAPYMEHMSYGLPAAFGRFRVLKLPLTFLPAGFESWCYPWTAQDGLICVRGWCRPACPPGCAPPCFCVLNPVTRQCKVLHVPSYEETFIELFKVQGVAPAGFKLVIVADDPSNRHCCVHVYSSSSDTLRKFRSHLRPRHILYVRGSNLVYDLDSHQLLELDEDPPSPLQMPRRSFQWPCWLIGHGGDLFSVGQTTCYSSGSRVRSLSSPQDGHATSFEVWKLDQGSGSSWSSSSSGEALHLVSKMPDAMFNHLQQPRLHNSVGPAKLRLEDRSVSEVSGTIFFIVHTQHMRRMPSSPLLRRLLPRERQYAVQAKHDNVPKSEFQTHYMWSLVGFHLLRGTWQVYLYNIPGRLSINYHAIKFMDFGGNHSLS